MNPASIQRALATLVLFASLLLTDRADALVDGLTLTGSTCIGSNRDAEHFAARAAAGFLTSLTAGVNSDHYLCAVPTRPTSGQTDFGSKAWIAVRGVADCTLQASDRYGNMLVTTSSSTGSVASGTETVLRFDTFNIGSSLDATVSIDCTLPNGSSIDAYALLQCLDADCDATEEEGWCGNGVVESGEECDDGNNINDDGCTVCAVPTCEDFSQNQGEDGIDCGGPCPACVQALSFSGATAGGAVQTPPDNAVDNNLATRYTNDGQLASASLQLHLAEPAVISRVSLAMYQGGTRTYPLAVKVGNVQVFSGSTQTAADFWSTTFPGVYGDTVTVTMTGANSSGSNWLSVWEARAEGSSQPTCDDGVRNQGEAGIDCAGPCARSCGQEQLEVFQAVAGGAAQTPGAAAVDTDPTTRYTNDGTLSSAELTVELQRTSTISGLQLLMYNGANRTYPIQVAVDASVVFTGSTALSAGYWTLSFAPTVGKSVTIAMTGPNSAGHQWFSVFEARVLGTPPVAAVPGCNNGVEDPSEDDIDCGGLCPYACVYPLPLANATASSVEVSSHSAAKAIDGNASTRWASAQSDPQWLSVDLGAIKHIEDVSIHWEAATSADYDIQVSDSGASGSWTTLRTVTNPSAGNRLDKAKYLGGVGRYLRIYSRARSTAYGNSIYELAVLGY